MPEEIKIEGANYIVSGKPRFLVGAEYPEAFGHFRSANNTDMQRNTSGYMKSNEL